MTDPRIPRPPKLPPHYENFDRRMHDTVPPAVKRSISEHDVKVSADTMAMARALTTFQQSMGARFDRLEVDVQTARAETVAAREQIAAQHGYIITLREYLVKQTRIRGALTILGAAIGAGVALALRGLP